MASLFGPRLNPCTPCQEFRPRRRRFPTPQREDRFSAEPGSLMNVPAGNGSSVRGNSTQRAAAMALPMLPAPQTNRAPQQSAEPVGYNACEASAQTVSTNAGPIEARQMYSAMRAVRRSLRWATKNTVQPDFSGG